MQQTARKREIGDTPPRRRLSGEERRQAIVDSAARTFAECGLNVGTRELARRLGVTQALLYRYFPSKADLVEAVVARALAGRWNPGWDALLAARDRPVQSRLQQFYAEYVGGIDPDTMRLFMRLNLDGHPLARRFAVPLTEKLLEPVIAALRAEIGLPPPETCAMMHGERELAMALHGGQMFLAIRKHLYRMPMTGDLDSLTDLQIRTWLPGAFEELRRLHGEEADGALTVRQLVRPAPQRRSR